MKRIYLGGLLCFSLSTGAIAGDNEINMSKFSDNKQLFGDLIEDLGAAMSYRAVTPAEPLGILPGVDVGMEVTRSQMKTDGWKSATEGNGKSSIYMGKIHVHKGLPMGFDVGAYYGSVMDSNIKSVGGEIRYAILSGTALTPALAVRGSYTLLSGVDNLDLSTTGLELSISKGFLMLTPYAGVGAIRYSGDGSTKDTNFDSESDTLAKYFLGVNFNLGLVNVAAEADKTGESSSYSAKFGLRF